MGQHDTKDVLFSDFLRKHRRGALDAEIAAAVAECAAQTARVGDVKKTGSVTIKLTIGANGLEAPTVTFVDEVAVKVPQFGRPASVYYIDTGGRLSTTDPMTQLTIVDVKDGGDDE